MGSWRVGGRAHLCGSSKRWRDVVNLVTDMALKGSVSGDLCPRQTGDCRVLRLRAQEPGFTGRPGLAGLTVSLGAVWMPVQCGNAEGTPQETPGGRAAS